jgi:hypothetical protein
MNERIKELYEQALEQYVSNNLAWEELNPQKFAELIVKECCDEIVEMADKYATFNGNVRRHIMHGAISEKLKEHFGVEG